MTQRPLVCRKKKRRPEGQAGASAYFRVAAVRQAADQSFLSMFQNIGIAAPEVTPVSDFRHTLGTLYSPSGM